MSPVANKPTILVVDDDRGTIELIQMMLEIRGYRVLLAHTGLEAVDLVQQYARTHSRWRPLPIDLILLDIMMPGIDGFKVCQHVKNDPLFKYVPVIMVTALENVSDKVAAVEFGADGYITKPFLPEELGSVIKAKLQVKRREEELLRRNVELETINAVAAAASSTLNPQRVLEASIKKLIEHAPVCAAAIYLIDPSDEQLRRMIQHGVQCPETASLQEGLLAQIVNRQQPTLLSQLSGQSDLAFEVSAGNQVDVFMGIPLRGTEHTLGVLELYGREPSSLNEADIAVFVAIGDRIGSALENAQLFQNAQTLLSQSYEVSLTNPE
ncbi:MAG: response regulator [Anaerolineae bacterium]|nr:response regulator [Anaerolineae bacterium]